VEGIRKYLGSGLIKGIGPVMAKRIVNRFGERTLDVIDQEVERPGAGEGIGPYGSNKSARPGRIKRKSVKS